jgi:hypothetical protein
MTVSYADDTMNATPGSDAQPAWVLEELPAEYAELARQIAALKEQALRYESVAGVIWRTGPALTAAVRDLFASLQFEVELVAPGANYDLRVDLEGGRRLLVEVVANPAEAIDRRSPHIARILRALQEDAGEKDRVVLAANIFSELPVGARRQDPVTVEAMRLIQGLGANFVPTSALFGVWKSSLQDLPQARKSIIKLYSMDGGIFR